MIPHSHQPKNHWSSPAPVSQRDSARRRLSQNLFNCRYAIQLFFLAACSSSTAPSIITDLKLVVQYAVSIEQPGSSTATIRFDVSFNNEGSVEARAFLCALTLQKERAPQEFGIIGSNGCIEQSQATIIPPRSSITKALTTTANAADISPTGNYRIVIPIFSGADGKRSVALQSETFGITGSSMAEGSFLELESRPLQSARPGHKWPQSE